MVYKITKLLVLFLFFNIFSTNCPAQNLNNLVFLTNLADSLIEGVTKQFVHEKLNHVLIRRLVDNSELNWFFESRLVKSFKRNSVDSIYIDSANQNSKFKNDFDSPALVFEFNVLSIGIEYTENVKEGQSPDILQRKATIDALLRVLQIPSGKILWSDHLKGKKSGTVPSNQIAVIESDNFSFTKGKMIKHTNKKKFFQPIIVTSVTGVIVFLFYALRSR